MDSLATALVLGRVVEAQSSVDGLKARLQRLDRPVGIETDWIQIASPMAGPKAGFSFMPEPGDVAVVAFTGRRAIILGFIYAGGAETFEDGAEKRLIASRDGNALILTDGDESGITLKDKHGNEITMTADGISIKTGKDLTIEAAGTTTIKGAVVELNP